ncbi:MAG TPA: sigma 54-interacting transcriptional regulator [Terriglobales bacterium]|nr:sigma 54-interacting transcriptional regulator [Terriglobales bacterium]
MPQAAVRECILPSWIARDPVSLALLTQVRRVASSRSSLLIIGEPGVGKDLLASVIHYLGRVPEAPLLRVDCAAFPSPVLDGELFGRDISTTVHACRGRIELAGHGTLVLDEIGALSLPLQLRVLRAIEEGRFQSNGDLRFVPTNARLLALTTNDLQQAVAMGSFREDLYYRLAVVPLVVPPLRQRLGDVAALAEHFLDRACRLHHRSPLRFSRSAMARLESYAWPGNVSELRALVERLASSGKDEIKPEDLPAHIGRTETTAVQPRGSLEELERSYIAQVLDFTRGRKGAAAGILGISRKTLLEKRKRYGLT